MSLIETARIWLERLRTYSFPIQLAARAGLIAVGAFGVGVVTKFGAYGFVLYYGVRTPADGIPYVAETAVVLSFVALKTAAIAYTVLVILFRGLDWLWTEGALLLTTNSTEERRKERENYFANPHPKAQLLVRFIFPTVFLAIGGYRQWKSAPWPNTGFWGHMLPIVPVLFVSAINQFKKAQWVAILSAGTVLLASFALWHPPTYGRFLRFIGHGGGRSVTVLVGEGPLSQKVRGYLVVRTGTALLLFDGKSTVREIPLSTVAAIDQGTHDYWCLPGCDCEYRGSETRPADATFR